MMPTWSSLLAAVVAILTTSVDVVVGITALGINEYSYTDNGELSNFVVTGGTYHRKFF